MRSRLVLVALFAGWSFLPVRLMAQANDPNLDWQNSYRVSTFGLDTLRLVGGKVRTARGDPVIHATVEIQNSAAGATKRVVLTDTQGEYRTEYQILNQQAMDFSVTVTVKKKGFRDAHKFGDMSKANNNFGWIITLRPLQPENPNLLSQVDLIKGVAPRLRQLGPADGLSAKDEKDYARGVQEFLDRNHVDRAVPYFAKVAKLNPSCLRCRTMLALAELSWGDWDDAQYDLAESINALLLNRKLGSPEPLLTYGVLESWGQEPAKASPYFNEALKYAPQDPLALQEYGRAQCLDLNWDAANDLLTKALAAGAGPEARLLHAQALLWVGTLQEASAELDRYLDGRNLKDMPPRVRSLWERIQEAKKDEVAFRAANAKAKGRGEPPLDYIHHPPQNLPDFEPASEQAPLDAILVAVGKNVSELFADLPDICSVEKIHQEVLTHKGKPELAQESKYRYLLTTPNRTWGPSIEEYRADMIGNETSPLGSTENYMLTKGFVSAPLIFHPAYQGGSSFRLLGSQKVKGRKTFLIAYAQEPAKSRLSGSFKSGSNIRLTYSQGLAWVDAENYQIVRLTTDLLKPLPQIRLEKVTTEIDFNEIQLNRLTQRLWLPDAVTVTLDWNGRVLRNKHTYSDFLVSNVDVTQRIGKPKGQGKAVEEANEPAPRSKALEDHPLSLVPPETNP
jgi:tetratricopeptide (TPR) repeat protein